MTTANPFQQKRSAAGAAPDSFATAESTKPTPAPKPAEAPPAAKSSGDPFTMPTGPGSGEKITDHMGRLLLITPLELITDLATTIGTSDAVRCDMVILDGDRQGEKVEGVLVFQMALRRDLQSVLNGPSTMLIGRLGRGQAKAGKSAPYIFEQPEEDDVTLARQYLASV